MEILNVLFLSENLEYFKMVDRLRWDLAKMPRTDIEIVSTKKIVMHEMQDMQLSENMQTAFDLVILIEILDIIDSFKNREILLLLKEFMHRCLKNTKIVPYAMKFFLVSNIKSDNYSEFLQYFKDCKLEYDSLIRDDVSYLSTIILFYRSYYKKFVDLNKNNKIFNISFAAALDFGSYENIFYLFIKNRKTSVIKNHNDTSIKMFNSIVHGLLSRTAYHMISLAFTEPEKMFLGNLLEKICDWVSCMTQSYVECFTYFLFSVYKTHKVRLFLYDDTDYAEAEALGKLKHTLRDNEWPLFFSFINRFYCIIFDDIEFLREVLIKYAQAKDVTSLLDYYIANKQYWYKDTELVNWMLSDHSTFNNELIMLLNSAPEEYITVCKNFIPTILYKLKGTSVVHHSL